MLCREKTRSVASYKGEDYEEAAQKLFDLVKFFQDSVKVVRLDVASEANAYTVFETLNDRGLDLSVLDLVKNHVFGTTSTSNQLRDAQNRWSQMTATLANVPADDFLKVWWTSRHGRVQSAQLFPNFKREISTAGKAVDVSKDLLQASEIFAALEIADDPLWADVSNKTKTRVRALKLLGGRQTKPILLSAIEKLEIRELERMVHLLEVVIVRYQLIGGGRTGKLEISAARLAEAIYSGEVNTATEAKQYLKDVLPSDDEFKAAFSNKQEKNNQKVKYVLSNLEMQAARGSGEAPLGDELEPLSTLTVEHIFPRSPAGEWKKIVEDDPTLVEDGTYKLGNMCLLTEVNRSLGDKEFAEKKDVYKESRLVLTREISEEAEWKRKQIDDRQALLAKLASAHWRFD